MGEILLWDHSNETYLRRRHHFNTVVIRFSACYKMKVGFLGGLFLFNSNVNDLLVSRFFFLFFFLGKGASNPRKKKLKFTYISLNTSL